MRMPPPTFAAEVGHVVTYNPSGDAIAIGMTSGAVAFLEASSASLRVFTTLKVCAFISAIYDHFVFVSGNLFSYVNNIQMI